uniref:DUF38 domain-containing protein n=1 Tax=Romanomermis culicivorax TaxID=13658 RepID=A0A915HQZ3_ROMCU
MQSSYFLKIRLNLDYKICLSECTSSNEGRLLLAGLKPWLFICDSNNERKLELFLRCFWTNSDKMEKMCNRQMTNINYALQDLINLKTWRSFQFRQLCQYLNEHDKCYGRSVHKFCGLQEFNFIKDLSEINNATLLEIFRFDPTLARKLPPECVNKRTEILFRKNITVTTTMMMIKNFGPRNGLKRVHDYEYMDFESKHVRKNSGNTMIGDTTIFKIAADNRLQFVHFEVIDETLSRERFKEKQTKLRLA